MLNLILTFSIGLCVIIHNATVAVDGGLDQIFSFVQFNSSYTQVIEYGGYVVRTAFEGKLGQLMLFVQQSAQVTKLVRGSSIAGMIISVGQLIVKAVLLSQKNKILEKISGIKID
jgi:hypothetical protein